MIKIYMKLNKDHPKYIEAFAYVKRSENREQVIKVLANGRKIPKNILIEMDIRFSTLSRILSELKEKDIVVCINEDDKTGRIYELTELGTAIHEELQQE